MNKLYIPLYALMLAGISSCEKNFDPIPDDFSSIIVMQEFGEKNVALYDTGENTSFEFNVFKSGKNPEVSTQVGINVLDAASLSIYAQNIGRDYVLLPSSTYDLMTGKLDFSSADRSKKGQIVFKTPDIKTLINSSPDVDFVLPVELVKMNSADSINAERKLLLIRPQIFTPVIRYREEQGNVAFAPTDTQKTYEFRLELPFVSPWDFECQVEVGNVAQSGYDLVPSTNYTLSTDKVVFKKGNSVSEPIVVTMLNGEILRDNYMLPIKVTNSTKSGILLPTDAFNLFVVFNKIPLTETMITANYTQAGDGGGIPALIDGKLGTYYHSQYWPNAGTEPHYIQAHLPSLVKKLRLNYTGRMGNPNGNPQDIIISVSNDGNSWTQLTRIDSGLPTSAGASYSSDVYESSTSFSHVRIEVMRTTTGSAPRYFVMSEMSLFGK